jgi:hypothetical protein
LIRETAFGRFFVVRVPALTRGASIKLNKRIDTPYPRRPEEPITSNGCCLRVDATMPFVWTPFAFRQREDVAGLADFAVELSVCEQPIALLCHPRPAM